MSETKGQQHEPSMEEILASIRRIIAEDGDTSAPPEGSPTAAGPKPADSSPAAPAIDEILELTEVIEADGSVVSLSSPAAEAVKPPAPVAPPPQPPRQAPEPMAPLDDDELFDGPSIVSAATAAASVAALSQITALSGRSDPRRSEHDIPLGAGHLTLEMLVREELRPILKDWLDSNLPEMVERLVRVEIARLVSDVQRR
jgi:cell pole-organizing protein PopZ